MNAIPMFTSGRFEDDVKDPNVNLYPMMHVQERGWDEAGTRERPSRSPW